MTVEGTVTVPRDWPSVLYVALIVSKTHPPSSVWFPVDGQADWFGFIVHVPKLHSRTMRR